MLNVSDEKEKKEKKEKSRKKKENTPLTMIILHEIFRSLWTSKSSYTLSFLNKKQTTFSFFEKKAFETVESGNKMNKSKLAVLFNLELFYTLNLNRQSKNDFLKYNYPLLFSNDINQFKINNKTTFQLPTAFFIPLRSFPPLKDPGSFKRACFPLSSHIDFRGNRNLLKGTGPSSGGFLKENRQRPYTESSPSMAGGSLAAPGQRGGGLSYVFPIKTKYSQTILRFKGKNIGRGGSMAAPGHRGGVLSLAKQRSLQEHQTLFFFLGLGLRVKLSPTGRAGSPVKTRMQYTSSNSGNLLNPQKLLRKYNRVQNKLKVGLKKNFLETKKFKTSIGSKIHATFSNVQLEQLGAAPHFPEVGGSLAAPSLAGGLWARGRALLLKKGASSQKHFTVTPFTFPYLFTNSQFFRQKPNSLKTKNPVRKHYIKLREKKNVSNVGKLLLTPRLIVKNALVLKKENWNNSISYSYLLDYLLEEQETPLCFFRPILPSGVRGLGQRSSKELPYETSNKVEGKESLVFHRRPGILTSFYRMSPPHAAPPRKLLAIPFFSLFPLKGPGGKTPEH
ncbi:MAG: hypothetical protein ACT6RN_26780 [Agrobacterium sp.]|uniref:hypothetical protein n=1 Tax=Agrobacterium sp. TaxID=361 RepID=UPI0040384037